jgi:hypothetical protein
MGDIFDFLAFAVSAPGRFIAPCIHFLACFAISSAPEAATPGLPDLPFDRHTFTLLTLNFALRLFAVAIASPSGTPRLSIALAIAEAFLAPVELSRLLCRALNASGLQGMR